MNISYEIIYEISSENFISKFIFFNESPENYIVDKFYVYKNNSQILVARLFCTFFILKNAGACENLMQVIYIKLFSSYKA